MEIFTQVVIWYFVIINVVTFVVRGVDKWKAKHQKWRIREKTLLAFAGAGGRVGSLFAMEFLRHKTIKGKFLMWFWLWTGLWIVALISGFVM